MTKVSICLLVGIVASLFTATNAAPIFWFLPWNSWIPSSTSSGSSSNSASASTGTTRMPVNATIALGNRRNTSALVDMGTNIDGLSITSRGRRSVPSGNESYIQVGNQVIKIPPGGVSNLTINIVDGVPHLVPEVPFWPVHAADEGSSSAGFVGRIRNFLDELFKPK